VEKLQFFPLIYSEPWNDCHSVESGLVDIGIHVLAYGIPSPSLTWNLNMTGFPKGISYSRVPFLGSIF